MNKKSSPPSLSGTFSAHPRGFGFVSPDQPQKYPQDIFIPKPFVHSAVHGDHVKVQLSGGPYSDKGPDGKIVEVLERARTHLGGTIVEISDNIEVYAPLLGKHKRISIKMPKKAHKEFSVGDRLVMKVKDWGNDQSSPKAEIEEVIGHISDASLDARAAALEFEIPLDFPEPATKEALAFGNEVSKADFKGRTDLTQRIAITIDPETAKDFDDALTIEKKDDGNTLLIVHIADVSHYIRSGSALDTQARARNNTTYFPGTCYPMIPHELSDNLCSLVEGKERLTVSIFMTFTPTGKMLSNKIERSVIKSARRFSYEEALEVLEGKLDSPYAEQIHALADLGRALKSIRTERGSVDLSLPEMTLQIDESGVPTGMRRVEYDITHQMVEEFMLKTNETVAKTLSDRGEELIFRIHEQPEDSSFKDFIDFARALNLDVPKQPRLADVQAIIDAAQKTPSARQLTIAFIRSMKMAIYSPENVGHFGLMLDFYAHFTSPIRRYSDLVVHRILFGESIELDVLKKIATDCSSSERKSAKAENHVRTLKTLRYLKRLHKKNRNAVYKATVTKVKPFGLIFELDDTFTEGFIPLSGLDGYFLFSEEKQQLNCPGNKKNYCVSSPLKLKLEQVDLIQLEARWAIKK